MSLSSRGGAIEGWCDDKKVPSKRVMEQKDRLKAANQGPSWIAYTLMDEQVRIVEDVRVMNSGATQHTYQCSRPRPPTPIRHINGQSSRQIPYFSS